MSEQIQKNDLVSLKKIRIVALRRSGHHAILNWILNQLPGPYYSLNDPANLKNRGVNIKRLLNGTLELNQDLVNYVSGIRQDAQYLVYNLEDLTWANRQRTTRWLGIPEENTTDILILRDVFNNVASRLKRRENFPTYAASDLPIKEAIELWKEHAKVYLAQPDTCINYNKWVESKEYRESVASRYGLTFTDQGLNNVPFWGAGSSFDRLSYNGKAEEMKVNSRYEQYQTPNFLARFDEEVRTLCYDIFGLKLEP